MWALRARIGFPEEEEEGREVAKCLIRV